ncbi:ATP-binding cassette domain-containing protein [Corynebacterium accolens]|uniref:ATP-binding cassette domain-containing protein n=1 Tax=Corynebacterium accolens TaxID=38284 RepID=UPI002542EE78|nr:ATP-binding cassette domain-containing protein [Corynebacterium accolens]MDK4233070.1 ATP-binding cassette domain-containing protein [Corynebacterium accolens]
MPISFSQLSLSWPDGTPCFSQLSGTIPDSVTGMIGDNGSGKSTLAKVLSHQIAPSSGTFTAPEVTYLDQDLGLRDSLTIAEVFGAAEKIAALHALEAGNYSEELLKIIGTDWDIEDRIHACLHNAGVAYPLDRTIGTISGGEAVTIALNAAFLITQTLSSSMSRPITWTQQENPRSPSLFPALLRPFLSSPMT